MARAINAIDVIFSIGGVVVGCSTGSTFTVSRAMDPATCGASEGWAESSPGLKSWSGNVSAELREFETSEEATNVSAFDVFDLLDEGTLVDVEYGTKEAGKQRFKGKAFVSGFTYTRPESGVVTWSADLTGSGALGKVTVPTV